VSVIPFSSPADFSAAVLLLPLREVFSVFVSSFRRVAVFGKIKTSVPQIA
jgi:hypothetical protein